MIQAGETPSYASAPPASLKSGSTRMAAKVSPTRHKPQFGSSFTNASVDRFLIPTFQNITENFLWGFIGIDFACMWLPRTLTALTTGAIPYDPNKDPKSKNLPFHKQAGRWVKGTAQGLNWSNLQEETKREVASGPGSVAISALMFLGVRHLWNKRTMELSHPALEGLSQGYEQHLRSHPIKGDMDERVYRKALASYVNSIFTDPALRATRLDTVIEAKHRDELRDILSKLEHPGSLDERGFRFLQGSPVVGPILSRQQGLGKKLRSMLSHNAYTRTPREMEDIRQELSHRPMLQLLLEQGGSHQTFDDYLRRWSQSWSETALNSGPDALGRKERLKQLKALREDLSDTLESFNQAHRKLPYNTGATFKNNSLASAIKDDQPLHHINKIWVRYTPEYNNVLRGTLKSELPVQKNLSDVTEDLGKWADFAQSAWKRQSQDPERNPADLVDKLRKQMVSQKFGLAVLGSALGAAYMIHLAAWCQNHGSYQATRTLNLKHPPGNPAADSAAPAQFSRSIASQNHTGQASKPYAPQTFPAATVQASQPQTFTNPSFNTVQPTVPAGTTLFGAGYRTGCKQKGSEP